MECSEPVDVRPDCGAMRSDSAPTTTTRKVGRPRAGDQQGSGDPVADILDAAAAMFCSIGYTATSTRQIADAAGLRQPSLFHYFERKDDILAELLDRTVTPALAVVEWLGTVDAEPDVVLATLMRADVANIVSLPHNLGTLILLPESRSQKFQKFQDQRMALWHHYHGLVTAAMAVGRLDVHDASFATNLIFGLVESVITWSPVDDGVDPADVGTEYTRFALRALLHDRRHVLRLLNESRGLLTGAPAELGLHVPAD